MSLCLPSQRLPLWLHLLPLLVALCLGWYWRGRYDGGAVPAITAHVQQNRADGSVLAARVAATAVLHQALPAGAAASMTFQVTTRARRPVYVGSGHVPGAQAGAAVPGLLADPSGNKLAGSPENAAVINGVKNGIDNDAGKSVGAGAVPAGCADYVAHLQCPALTLAGTLVRERDGQPDLLLSADGATLASARLVVATPPGVPKRHANALGIAWPLAVPGAAPGIMYERDVEVLPLRLSGTGFTVNGRPALLLGLAYRW